MRKSDGTFKLLASADLHMNNRMPYARPSADGRTDRLDEQLVVLRQMRKEAAAHEVDGVLLVGDIFDKSLVDAVTLTHTIEEFVQFTCPLHILPGNHDANSLKGGRFVVEAFGAMRRDNLHFLHSEQPLQFGSWLRFWPLAFMPADETRAALDRIRARMAEETDPEADTNVLLFHNSIVGCTHIGWKCDDGLRPAEVCAKFDWVLAGHFHETQRFGAKGRGMYLGAPMHHHFGDVGRPAGFWIFTFHETGKREELFIKSDAPQFYQYDSLDAKLDAEAGDFVRYHLRATGPEWEAIKPGARAHVSALEMKGIRADFKHDPIYHHEARLSKTERTAALSIDDAVAQYVEMPAVVSGVLDKERLKALGREALAAVRSGHGHT